MEGSGNEPLSDLVAKYKKDAGNEEELYAEFYRLAESVYGSKSYYFQHDNEEKMLSEVTEFCLGRAKTVNLNTQRNVVNLFTTLIGCYLRQEKRRIKNVQSKVR
jgi:hypothetical protein